MLRTAASALSVLFLAFSPAAYADDGFAAWERAIEAKLAASAPASRAPSACTVCRTCGRDWPKAAGGIRPKSDDVLERGNECQGALQVRKDGAPLICCR